MDKLDPAAAADKRERVEADAWLDRMLARARATGPFAEFVDVTGALAKAMLDRNPANRKLVAAGVAEWREALAKGDWKVNGEPIIVADTGELNDGQHRLTAVAQTGAPMRTLVVFGVSRESRKTVDTGKKRTAAHVLGMGGVTNGALVASTAKCHMNLRLGVVVNTHRSTLDVERELEAYPHLLQHLQASYRTAREFRQSPGLFCALHHVMRGRRMAAADEFWRMLADGTGFDGRNNPVARLRSRLTENLANKAKLPNTMVAALVIKAWNAHADGRALTFLRWTTEGDNPEPFPQVRP